MAKLGFSPVDVDRWDMFQLRSVLGHHRPPEWWDAWDDARRVDTQTRLDGRGRLPSKRDRLSRSRSLFSARRAAARGEQPAPEAAEPGAGVAAIARMLAR